MINPTTPAAMKTVCQLYFVANQTVNGGAIIAPTELPATHKLFAVALSLPENHVVITFNCAGKLVGSDAPNKALKKVNCPKVLDIPPPIEDKDQPITPKNITFFAPYLSTSHPDTGYIKA